MRMLFIFNGLGFSNNPNMGGGDRKSIEIIKRLKNNHDMHILTTDSGYKIFKEIEKVDTKYYVTKRPSWWPTIFTRNLLGRVFSYKYAFFKALIDVRKYKNYDIYYATSDFFFDIIPGYFYKKINKKKLICIIHHYIENPFKRNGYFFINTAMYISQSFSIFLMKFIADKIFVYENDEGAKIKMLLERKGVSLNKIHFTKIGLSHSVIDKAKQKEKIYDAGFIAGIRYSKGIEEFIPIWSEVVKEFPNAKYLIMGGGSPEIVNKLKNKIKKAKLKNNIILTGSIDSNTQLFENLKQCKLFVFPSHEEGWGIAISEAMYCKLPVICYNLPTYKIFGKDIDKVNIGDYSALAKKVIYYLQNPDEINKTGELLHEKALEFKWDEIAKYEEKIYLNLITNK